MPPSRIVLWIASLGGIAFAVRSVSIGPVPTWIALLSLTAYGALILVGVLVPRYEMFGDVISRGDPERGGVALTFDDGPHPETTRRVLELLAESSAKATFFVLGDKATAHPDVVRDIAQAGHSLGVHGFHHDRLYALRPPSAVADDIARAQNAVESACGVRPHWFRPPIGQVSPRTAAGARRAGVEIVAWSVRSFDGIAGRDPERVAERVIRRLEPGAIVLLHDAAEHDDFTPAALQALPRVLTALAAKNLKALTLEEVLGEDSNHQATSG
jgi:peptidoglycan/xylan/chitin deacetylase (PgdA/CDA1 family)